MTTPDLSTTDTPAGPTTSANAQAPSGANLKAGLVLALVLLLVLIAGAGYLIKNNEPVARQLLSWNIQVPGWLLPASVSKSLPDTSSTNSPPSPSNESEGVPPSSSAAVSAGGSSSTLETPVSGGPTGLLDPANTPAASSAQGLASVSQPPVPVRPSPQLDPAFRQSLEGIDRLARSLAALPVGPQKPSLPEAVAPKPSGSLLAGVQAPTPDVQGSSTSVAENAPSPQVLEPGVFDKSLKFLQSLVRVQSVQGSDFAAQPQAFYQLVGQQMQAQLAAARLALLLGEVALAARELEQTEALLERHFDKADPKVFQLQAEFSGLRRQVESLQ